MKIRDLISRGTEVYERSRQVKEASRDIGGKVTVGVDILDTLFNLTGYKRTTKSIGKWWLHSNVTQQQQALDDDYERWYGDCRGILQQVSIYKKGLTVNGNSHTLLSRFTKTKGYVRTQTCLRHGLAFLESLLDEELIYNDDLNEYIKTLKKRVRARKNALTSVKALVQAKAVLQFPGADNIEKMLNPYPQEREAIEGAISTYTNKGPDANRQALASCRNCLERLICKLTGKNDWKEGLSKLTQSKTKHRYIRDTYQYLSAYGSHGSRPPSDVDTEFGIEMTLAAVKWILLQISES